MGALSPFKKDISLSITDRFKIIAQVSYVRGKPFGHPHIVGENLLYIQGRSPQVIGKIEIFFL